jgi:voltage-gated potassium channel
MTVITVLTIGYGEIIDLSNNPMGRVFTMLIAFSGIGTLTYILSTFTAFVVEGQLKEIFRMKKIDKLIKKFRHHYIVCGIGEEGFYIAKEFNQTQTPCLIIDVGKAEIERVLEKLHEQVFVLGDPTDDNTLLKAGILEAKGLFAVAGDDNQNLVISLTAKQLNPNIKVVAKCSEIKNIEKLKKAGADAVVSPAFIGGLRMASEMIRPTVVSFLDIMLRDKQKSLIIEEIPVPDFFIGKPISAVNLTACPHTLLIAIKTKEGWIYNPPKDYIIAAQNTLIFMTNPEERSEMMNIFL